MNLIIRFSEPLAVEARGLSRCFRNTKALHDLDIEVPEGAVYLLAGDNGSGKSTLLRTILDLSRPDAGTLTVFGLSPISEGAEVRSAIGYINEQAQLPYEKMNVAEFLGFCRSYYHTWDNDYTAQLVDEFEIDLLAKCGNLSKGGVRRVQITAALAHRPALLLLDEPADGLDPVARDRFFGLLARHLADSPTTVLMASHLVQESDLLCDHVGVISDGQLTAQLSREELERKLKRYVFELPEATDLSQLKLDMVDSRTADGESACVVWGSEEKVLGAISEAGGKARFVHSLSLAEATRALISQPGRVA